MTSVAAPQKHKFTADESESSSLQCVGLVLSIRFSAILRVLINAQQKITPYVFSTHRIRCVASNEPILSVGFSRMPPLRSISRSPAHRMSQIPPRLVWGVKMKAPDPRLFPPSGQIELYRDICDAFSFLAFTDDVPHLPCIFCPLHLVGVPDHHQEPLVRNRCACQFARGVKFQRGGSSAEDTKWWRL